MSEPSPNIPHEGTEPPSFTPALGRHLRASGWASGDGTELTERAAGHASWSTMAVLRRLGAFTDDGPRHPATKLTRDGMTFARAALYSWPQR
jgi:hypothetical protein